MPASPAEPHAWGTIAGASLLYLLWPSVLTLGVAVVVVGARQLGLVGGRMERAAGFPEIIGRAMSARSCRGSRLLGLVLAAVLLTACTGVPVPPAYTQDELAARCARTGGWWRPGTLIDGHCEYRN